MALNICIRREEKYKINNLSFHHGELEREEQSRSKTRRKEDTINSRAEIKETELRKK